MNLAPAEKFRKRFPSRREIRAVELGPERLMVHAEWVLRDRPRALRNLRQTYRRFCTFLLAKISRTGRKS